jgi:sortase A
VTFGRSLGGQLGVETTSSTDVVGGIDDKVAEVRATESKRRPWERAPKSVNFAVVSAVFVLAAVLVVNYALGSFVHDRDQRNLMAEEEGAINHAAGSRDGLYHEALPTQPPAPGDPVGILTIQAIHLQQVVVEGAGASQTVEGPGHVPGTAGLGQPGNSAVVGRGSAYGGAMGGLDQLEKGDDIVTATTQGESLYVVWTVRTVDLATRSSAPTSSSSQSEGPPSPTSTSASAPSKSGGASQVKTVQALYGPTSANQLTLVTSATAAPWNTNQAVVVVARLRGSPYAATPQESRNPSEEGTTGDAQVLPWLLLALLALAAVFVAATAIYHRCSVRSAYLLTTPSLLALTVIAAEGVGRLLPAWT